MLKVRMTILKEDRKDSGLPIQVFATSDPLMTQRDGEREELQGLVEFLQSGGRERGRGPYKRSIIGLRGF